jgi:hypothetical protein
MKYVADYVVSHLGTKHSGTVVLRGEDTPKVGDILAVRFAGLPMPVQIDSVNIRKEMYGIQHASLVCSTWRLSQGAEEGNGIRRRVTFAGDIRLTGFGALTPVGIASKL